MKRIVLCFAVFLFAANVGSACINTYGVNISGKSIEQSGFDYAVEGKYRLAELLKAREKLESQVKTDHRYQTLTDYAALLIMTGEPQKAIEILNGIEKQHPGEYNTAINLGTAYELIGNNQSALRWIKEGLRRNATSHQGSEWIHVKILESKIALEQNPHWLDSHPVLGLDFGKTAVPVMPLNLSEEEHNLVEELRYQLSERLFFIQPRDRIVAELLGNLADLYALKVGVKEAIPVYQLSLKYGHPNRGLLQQRLQLAKKINRENPAGDGSGPSDSFIDSFFQSNLLDQVSIIYVVIVAAIFLFFLIRKSFVLTRRWNNKPSEEVPQ